MGFSALSTPSQVPRDNNFVRYRNLLGIRDTSRSPRLVDAIVMIPSHCPNNTSNEEIPSTVLEREESGNHKDFVALLRSCGMAKDLHKGRQIHTEILERGLFPTDIFLNTALISMYAKCGAFEEAHTVFDKIPVCNIVAWNALISGYAQNELPREALKYFKKMQEQGVFPNTITFVCALKACGSIRSLRIGEDIHKEVMKQGLLNKNIILGNALVDMYAKCGALKKAEEVFEKLPERDVVSWSTLITGYAHHGLGDEALRCFRQMIDEGISPDAVTFICALKSCGCVGSQKVGEEIHAEVRKQRLLENNSVLGTALVDMYAKCGDFEKAEKVLEGLPVQNVESWSALISGYELHGLSSEALRCFRKMRAKGITPDAVTFLCVLKVCGIMGSLCLGEEVHVEICENGLLRENIVLGNTLLDMYTKCGATRKASEIFYNLPEHDVVSCNVLMAGYVQTGQVEKVFDFFSKMIAEGIMPSMITFLILLNGCTHAGLVEEGQNVFKDMSAIYSFSPDQEHYACMVDLFSRAGNFHQAMSLMEKVSPSDRLTLCLAFLGACHKWMNVEFGKWAFERLMHMDSKCGAAYVCMRNIYLTVGMHTEANNVDVWSKRNEAWEDTRMMLMTEG